MVTLASALIVATCAIPREVTPPPSPPIALREVPIPVVATEPIAPPMPSEMPSAAPSAIAAAFDATPPRSRTRGHELDGFYAALRSLEKHTRRDHVRIEWLGDSHGASDLWSGRLRDALKKRFGDGGPGLVHLGYKAYRHEAVRVEVKGKWAVIPKGPSTSIPSGDGVFGLGGMLFAGTADSPHASLTITDPALPASLSWDLCFKLGTPRDELVVHLAGAPDRRLKGGPLGSPQHVRIQSTGPAPLLSVVPLGGQPALCGVIIETDPATHPGVVLDTLGINGGRLTTPLAWNAQGWVTELSRRSPSLVILQYGTNEASDSTVDTGVYIERLTRVMERVHAASPAADCLVVGPTDRADTATTTPRVRDALREAAATSGCRFWDTYNVMGGSGSVVAWRSETPPRAGSDGVHLTTRGYHDLGDKLAADLMDSYGDPHPLPLSR